MVAPLAQRGCFSSVSKSKRLMDSNKRRRSERIFALHLLSLIRSHKAEWHTFHGPSELARLV